MTIKTSGSTFRDALAKVRGAVGGGEMTICNHVLVRAVGGRAMIKATNLSMEIEVAVPNAEVFGDDRAFTVPYAYVDGAMDAMGDHPVEISVPDGSPRVKVMSEYATARLSTMDADDFPEMRPKGTGIEEEIDATFLVDGIRRTSYAADRTGTRKSIAGTNLSFNGGEVRFVATDGKRLAISTSTREGGGGKASATIPTAAATAIASVFAKAEGPVAVRIYPGAVEFATADAVLRSKLIDEPYPRIEQVIPDTSHSYRAVVGRWDFRTAVDAASIMKRDAGSCVAIRFAENGDTGRVESKEISEGDAKATFKVRWDGPATDVCLDAELLTAPLRAVGDDTVDIRVTTGREPIVVEATDFLYVLMPMMVN